MRITPPVSAGARGAPIISLVVMVVAVDAIAMVTTARAAVLTAESGKAAAVLALCVLTASGFASLLRAASAPLHRRERDPRVPRIPLPRQAIR